MPSYQNQVYSLGYMDPGDEDARHIKQMKDHFYLQNYTGASAIWSQGAIDKRFKIGDTTLYSSAYGKNVAQYQKFFFNMIKRHGNMISGFQRKNRKSTITVPRMGEEADELADDYNKVIRWSEDRDCFQEYFSQSFEGGIDVGINWLWMYNDYTYDPISGDLFTDSVSFNNVLWDQNFHKMDLTDCQGVWRRRWVSKNMLKQLLPGYESELKNIRPSGAKDGRFPLQAELQNLQISNLYTYDEFYYRSTREAIFLMDPYTQEYYEWEDDLNLPDGALEMALQRQPWLKKVKKQIPTVKMCLSIGDRVVYDGQNHLNVDLYPCVPHLCYHEPDVLSYSGRLMGYIRNLRDPQFLYNMRKIIELQILQSQVNAGWIYPVDAVVDPQAFRQASGGDAFVIPLKAGRSPAEIQRIEPSALPGSLLELSRSLSEDITKISGVNEELLGMADDDKSGILSMLRQSAGLVTLQNIFDKSDMTQRLYGKLRLEAIRKNFKINKVKDILGKMPHPKFFLNNSQKYQVSIEEGNYSTTQRQMELQQYLHFKQLGMNIPDETIIRAAFITNKKQVMQEMQQQNQAAQQQQQAQMQGQAQESQSKIMLDQAKAQTELARQRDLMMSAAERQANVENIKAAAQYREIESDLGIIKMAMELEDVQFNQLKNAVEFVTAVKEKENENNSLNMQNKI